MWGCVLVPTSLNVQCHDLDTVLFCQTSDWCNFHVNTTCGGLWNKSCLKLIMNYCNLQACLISAAYLNTALFEMTLWHLGWIITMRNWIISRWIISFKCEHAVCFSVFDCHVHSPTVFSWFCSVICRNSKCSNSVFTTSRFLRSSIHTYSYLCMCNWTRSESITLSIMVLLTHFLGRRNSTHSLIRSGEWVLFVQLEKHKLNLQCLMCVAFNARKYHNWNSVRWGKAVF